MQKTGYIGVIGAGSFGTAVAQLLAENHEVLVYTRTSELGDALQNQIDYKGWRMHPRVHATQSLEELANECFLIFPVVPSSNFRNMMKEIAPFLRPDHVLIHGTKGLDVQIPEGESLHSMKKLNRTQIKTMTEVIQEESVVKKIGCIAGPNLAKEIQVGFPAATVIASRFDEVIKEGTDALNSEKFRVYKNYDLLGVELCGVLKNIMAIAAGMVSGLGFGDNTRALLIARGMAEMALFGQKLGATPHAFLGLAGIGDLVATCCSPHSRNFTVGYRLAKGETLKEILSTMTEVAEGVKTVQIATKLSEYYNMREPIITRTLNRILFEDMQVSDGVKALMKYKTMDDVEFI
jgi:glycerol-3-phosphate dehydrogenase (NAD(P)+)